MKLRLFLSSVVLLSILGVSQAAYKMGTSEKALPLDSSGNPVVPEKKKKAAAKKIIPPKQSGLRKFNEMPYLAQLSEQYNIEVEKLIYLRNLNHGYEELVPALAISKEAQVEVGKVLNSRVEGTSWKKIMEKYSVNAEYIDQEALKILTPMRKLMPKEILLERPKTGTPK